MGAKVVFYRDYLEVEVCVKNAKDSSSYEAHFINHWQIKE